MRLIPLADLELALPAGWVIRAAAALAEVKAATAVERARAISARNAVWSSLGPALAGLSSKKCWYCESRQIRSDKAVDHFRPKNRVAENRDVPGYWWLAFEWRNYRYSCTYCNSRRSTEDSVGGKQDHFPLFDERTRGQPEESPATLDGKEQLKLLDPTSVIDVQLITFEVTDGSAVPAVDKTTDPNAYERAVISIEVYHLQEEQLRRERFAKMREVRERLERAKGLPAGDQYKVEVVAIAQAIRNDAEYSAAARAMLKSFRGTSKLAETILDL